MGQDDHSRRDQKAIEKGSDDFYQYPKKEGGYKGDYSVTRSERDSYDSYDDRSVSSSGSQSYTVCVCVCVCVCVRARVIVCVCDCVCV